jgi:hypothetical protein
MQRYDNNNHPKVGDVVFVTEDCWYTPYHNTWQIVTRWDLTDPWLTGCDEYPVGICVDASHLVKPTPYSESNHPQAGDKVVILGASPFAIEDGAKDYFGKTFTVVLADGDSILIDCPVYMHGLWTKYHYLAPAVFTSEQEVSPEVAPLVSPNVLPSDTVGDAYVVTETNPYDLPCDFKVGDEVECLFLGAGRVVSIDTALEYPFRVESVDGCHATYSVNGKYSNQANRTLFHKGTVKLVAIEQQYEPQYNTGDYLYAMKDGKITSLEVWQDYQDRVVNDKGFVFLKSEFTFHLPA